MSHTCRWVLSLPGESAVCCGQPVGYHIVRDDDGNRVRKYDAFCEEHLARAQADEERAEIVAEYVRTVIESQEQEAAIEELTRFIGDCMYDEAIPYMKEFIENA